MFGRHADRARPDDQDVDVDVHLEHDITVVQQAADAYLNNPSQVVRQELLAALEALDRQTAAADAYQSNLGGSAVFGFTPKGSVIGETGQYPLAEELPGSVLRAQVTLVKAARAAVTGPGPTTFDALRTASLSLTSMQPPEPESGRN